MAKAVGLGAALTVIRVGLANAYVFVGSDGEATPSAGAPHR